MSEVQKVFLLEGERSFLLFDMSRMPTSNFRDALDRPCCDMLPLSELLPTQDCFCTLPGVHTMSDTTCTKIHRLLQHDPDTNMPPRPHHIRITANQRHSLNPRWPLRLRSDPGQRDQQRSRGLPRRATYHRNQVRRPRGDNGGVHRGKSRAPC